MDNCESDANTLSGEPDAVGMALHSLDRAAAAVDRRLPIAFGDFLKEPAARPQIVVRNIFQIFHDMVKAYVGEGVDEYLDDPESIITSITTATRLLVLRVDHPFFADRLFANRLMNHVESLRTAGLSKTRSTSSGALPAAAKAPFSTTCSAS